ncbi:TRAP transporter large permease subunit [Rhodospirillaceae bacterium SYSU D60014]|uniref:TRAP transporter large permease n=1 Tax=Virgifigura deserti TaxID=2268457 RepID=UPI000E6682F2
MLESFGEALSLLMFAGALAGLLLGFPVAFSLAGVAVIFAAIGWWVGVFDWVILSSVAGRIVSIMVDETLVAVPLFIFMGIVLERSKIAEDLLITMGQLFGRMHGGLGLSVIMVGALLAASTGIVGATVVTMGLISLPAMMRANYSKSLASGVICASGTLAQLIPPSTVLILLGIMLQNANTQANLRLGRFDANMVTVTDLFAAALMPGLILVLLYMAWMAIKALMDPKACPPLIMTDEERRTLPSRILKAMVPPLALIIIVLGSILTGIATATESAAMGALGACVLAALRGSFTLSILREVSRSSLMISTMIFAILIGATIFSLVFRGLGGEEVVTSLISDIPGGVIAATAFVLAVMFFLGFLIDTFEIIFIVVPIFAPVLIMMGADPLWLGVAMGIVLQTSYLTPPFGFAIFFLQGVAPQLGVTTIYRGVSPFIVIQLMAVVLIGTFPQLVTWLPSILF